MSNADESAILMRFGLISFESFSLPTPYEQFFTAKVPYAFNTDVPYFYTTDTIQGIAKSCHQLADLKNKISVF